MQRWDPRTQPYKTEPDAGCGHPAGFRWNRYIIGNDQDSKMSWAMDALCAGKIVIFIDKLLFTGRHPAERVSLPCQKTIGSRGAL
jgi:hypothetical protein